MRCGSVDVDADFLTGTVTVRVRILGFEVNILHRGDWTAEEWDAKFNKHAEASPEEWKGVYETKRESRRKKVREGREGQADAGCVISHCHSAAIGALELVTLIATP